MSNGTSLQLTFSLVCTQDGHCVESQTLIGRNEAEGREMRRKLVQMRRAGLKHAKSGGRGGAGRGSADGGRARTEWDSGGGMGAISF